MSRTPSLPQAARTSLVDSAIALIRGQIEAGDWPLGSRIPKETELAEMLSVGRNTVREAIRVLSHSGVLEVRQGDGTYVRSSVDPNEIMRRVTRSGLRDHFELRAMIDTEAARLAAQRRSKDDLANLRARLKARGTDPVNGDIAGFIERDLVFHATIVEASHNMALQELYRYLTEAIRINRWAATIPDLALPEPSLAMHARIVDAIADQDAEGAAAAARAVVMPIITKLQDQAPG